MKNLKDLAFALLTLIPCGQLFAQTSPQPGNVKLFFEKTYLQTDRTVYAPGEDIWFKAYIVNARDNHLIGTSKNLYVELISPADTLITKQIVQLNNGTGTGDFSLPGQLPAGGYRLRAYTNWQRNFGDNFIFEKAISITGDAPQANTMANAKKPVNTLRPVNSTLSPALAAPTLRFFPEGGSLVNEVSAIVAVKAEDMQGNGISIAVPVLSATGDTIARFTTDTLGMGLFTILPLAGQTYGGLLKYRGKTITVPLPAALNSGLTLKAVKRDTLLYITITANNAAAATLAGKTLTLSVKHAGTTFLDQAIQLTGNQASVKLPEGILPEGIAALTLYDDQHKPNCERLIYIDHGTHSATLAVNPEKNTYKPRERTVIKIKATDGKHRPVGGNFSVAVLDAGVNQPESNNITAYLMLQSEIKGRIAHADRYFDTTNVDRGKQLDLLLLTQGWRDFVWKRLAESPIKLSYLPEQGFTLSGKVTKGSSKEPLTDANITLSTPKAKARKLFFTKSDASGNYYFDNLAILGAQNVRVSTRNIKGQANGAITIDSLSKNNLPITQAEVIPNPPVSPLLAAEIERRAPINKKLDTVINLKEVTIKGNRKVVLRDQTAQTYGYPDEVLTPNAGDVKDFKNLKAYLLYASKQAKSDDDMTATADRIIFMADGKKYKPRFIVDNSEVPFTDQDPPEVQDHYYGTYLSLPMNVIEKVVIKRLLATSVAPVADGSTANIMGNTVAGAKPSTFGSALFVIYLTLKPGGLLRNSDGITTANVQGYYEARTFYKPIHNGTSADAQTKPDLRNTIHWEPDVKTDANGNATIIYYNADPKNPVRIIVQGVTDTGDPVSAVKTYVVK